MYYLHELVIILLFGNYIAAAVGLKSELGEYWRVANIKLHDTRYLDEWGCPHSQAHGNDWEDHLQDRYVSATWLPLLSTLESCLNFPWNQPVIMSKKLSPLPYRPRSGFPLSPQLLDTETSTAQPQPLQDTKRGPPSIKWPSHWPVTVTFLWRSGLIYWAKCKL